MVLAFAHGGCAYSPEAMPDSPLGQFERSAIAIEPRLTAFTTRNAVAGAASKPWFGAERAPRPTIAEIRLRPPQQGGFFSSAAFGGGDWALETAQILPDGLQWTTQAGRRDVLVYVHGFNNTFEQAALSAARLSDGIGFHGETILFSWPSRSALLDYIYDRESAIWSRDALENMLRELIAHPAVASVHVVAHSMGTMLSIEALRQLHARDGDAAARKIGAVVLAAPDIDLDVFASSVRRIGRIADRITVLTSTHDRALNILTRVAGGVSRVGAAEKEQLEAMGLRVIDASGFSGGGTNHDLFLSNEQVRQLVRRAIAEHAPLPVADRSREPATPLR